VAPKSRRHDPQRVEQPTAHAQEPDVQSQAELVGVTSACVDQRTLSRAEGEESLQLEAADVTWQLAHAKVRGLPALHRVASLEWTMHDTPRKSEQQSQSDQQLTNPTPRRCWLPVPSLIALKTSGPRLLLAGCVRSRTAAS
jgi:hypothetical protein